MQAAGRSKSVRVIYLPNNVNAPVCVQAVINSSHYGGHYSFGNNIATVIGQIDATELISFDRPRIPTVDVTAGVIEIS